MDNSSYHGSFTYLYVHQYLGLVIDVHLYLVYVIHVHLYLGPVNDEHLWYLSLKYTYLPRICLPLYVHPHLGLSLVCTGPVNAEYLSLMCTEIDVVSAIDVQYTCTWDLSMMYTWT
jgi:hypothetical protein